MSLHAYSRCWLHLVWATLRRERMLSKQAGVELAAYLARYAEAKGIYMKVGFVNADHVHVLIDLPTNMSIEDVVQLLKGSSSHWVSESNLVLGKFGWARGYGAFSVSQSGVAEVASYIAGQEEHHRKKSFGEELKLFVERYELKWHKETVETVSLERPRETPS